MVETKTTSYGPNESLGALPEYTLNTPLSFRIAIGNAASLQQTGFSMNGRTEEVIQDFFDDMATKSTITHKLQKNLEDAQQLITESDVIVVSLGLDGVLFDGYEQDGTPIFNENELNKIKMHITRARQELSKQNKKLVVAINSFREWPIIEPVMQAIDPTATNWFATLEGGHVVAYRDTFLPEEYSSELIEGVHTEFVNRNGKKAQVVKTYEDGSVLALESLLSTHPELSQIHLGDTDMSVPQAREKLNALFRNWLSIGAFGETAYLPVGRMGMVTARNVDEKMVKVPNDTLPLKGIVKKYFVPDNSPVMNGIRDALKLNSITRDDLPFDVIYYPGDGGLDIQFKRMDKVTGQWQMTDRMRTVIDIDEKKKIGILHIGDDGVDDISARMDELNAETVVVAVSNAGSDHLKDQAIALTTRPIRRGVAEALLILREISMGKVTPATLEAYKDQHSVGDHVKGYLGREIPREGDVDLRRIMEQVNVDQLADVAQLLEIVKKRGGRVFVYGNGGSFDNARLVVGYLNEAGIQAKTPGNSRLMKQAMEGGFSQVFIEGLKQENFNANDLVIGLSGSGKSDNVNVAHDYAWGIRMKALRSTFQELAGMGIIINTDLLDTKSLAEDPENIQQITDAIAAFEKSVAEAWDLAKDNPKAKILLRHIAESQNVVSLGGRDGGMMRLLTGNTFTILAKTDCMEALEDHNPIVMRAIANRIQGESIDTALKRAVEPLDTIRKPEVLDKLVRFAITMEKTIFNGGRVVIVGNQHKHPSVTHAEADWGRGMINMLPISGPDVVILERNLDALMALGNDDGLHFRYADQIEKVRLTENDVVVFIGDTTDEKAFDIALHEVIDAGAQTYIIGHDIGEKKADLPTEDNEVDVAATIVIHHISRAINAHMRAPDGVGWMVVPLPTMPQEIEAFIKEKMGDQKKLSRLDTLTLEKMLKEQQLLTDEQVITWCYGRGYIADHPGKYRLQRGFY